MIWIIFSGLSDPTATWRENLKMVRDRLEGGKKVLIATLVPVEFNRGIGA